MRCAAPVHGQSTAKDRSQPSSSEEEGSACRRQDISPCLAWCCCCAHFLQLFPAVSCSERSAGVKQAPPSIIILPSPATHPPSADNRTSPLSPFSPTLSPPTSALRDLSPLAFFSLLYDFHIFLPSICSPHRLAFLLVAIVRHHARAFLFHTSLGNSGFCHFETLC